MDKCSNCGKEYLSTLISFLGAECCPHCKEEIFPNKGTNLKITPESRTLYVQAERLFKEGYLVNEYKRFNLKKREDTLERASKKCIQAGVNLHDPYALNLLAYLYENNYVDNQTSRPSWEFAMECYVTVCFNENYETSGVVIHYDEESTKRLSAREVNDLRFDAGIGIIRLMRNVPQGVNFKKFNWARERAISVCQGLAVTEAKKSILESLNCEAPEYKDIFDAPLYKSADEISRILVEYTEKNKLLMYLAHMTKEEFNKLREMDLGRGLRNLLGYKKYMYVAIAPTHKRELKSSFRTLTDDLLKKIENQEADGIAMLLINTNRRIGVKGVKTSDLSRVLVQTDQNDQMLIRQWVRSERYNKYKITIDDIEICAPTDAKNMSAETLATAILKNLINSITE